MTYELDMPKGRRFLVRCSNSGDPRGGPVVAEAWWNGNKFEFWHGHERISSTHKLNLKTVMSWCELPVTWKEVGHRKIYDAERAAENGRREKTPHAADFPDNIRQQFAGLESTFNVMVRRIEELAHEVGALRHFKSMLDQIVHAYQKGQPDNPIGGVLTDNVKNTIVAKDAVNWLLGRDRDAREAMNRLAVVNEEARVQAKQRGILNQKRLDAEAEVEGMRKCVRADIRRFFEQVPRTDHINWEVAVSTLKEAQRLANIITNGGRPWAEPAWAEPGPVLHHDIEKGPFTITNNEKYVVSIKYRDLLYYVRPGETWSSAEHDVERAS